MELSVKIVMIGDSNVGKSQLSLRYCKKKFFSDSQSTVGIEFATRSIGINEYTVKAQIWDTAGQERFESMTKAYFRNAAAALLVYDIGNRQSFENMKNRWLTQLREFGHEDMFVVVVGNKNDIDPSKRKVSIAEAAEFAESTGLDFVETSARTGENVEIAFRRVIITVAGLLPGVKEHLRGQELPRGWVYVPSKKKYLNLWTNASTSNRPDLAAETGLLVTTIVKVPDVKFRDSSSSSSQNIRVTESSPSNSSSTRSAEVNNQSKRNGSKNCMDTCILL